MINALLLSKDIKQAIFSMLLIFLIFYPVYHLSVLGAGDVKLFMMMALFLNQRELSLSILFAFITALIFGIIKMKMKDLSIKETKVHIGLPVLIGFLICKGGFF